MIDDLLSSTYHGAKPDANVRNCLEHRGGRVGAKDVDPVTGILTLSFPRLQTFYMRGDEEVELLPGETIDTHAPDNPFGKEGVTVYLRRVTRTRDYALDEPVVLAAIDFFEIAMSCHLFAADLPRSSRARMRAMPQPASRSRPADHLSCGCAWRGPKWRFQSPAPPPGVR